MHINVNVLTRMAASPTSPGPLESTDPVCAPWGPNTNASTIWCGMGLLKWSSLWVKSSQSRWLNAQIKCALTSGEKINGKVSSNFCKMALTSVAERQDLKLVRAR